LTPERWAEVDRRLDEVLALPPEGRSAAVERLAGGDAELRRELRSLLAADARASGFLETPPDDERTDATSAANSAGIGLAVLDNIDVNGRLITRGD